MSKSFAVPEGVDWVLFPCRLCDRSYPITHYREIAEEIRQRFPTCKKCCLMIAKELVLHQSGRDS